MEEDKLEQLFKLGALLELIGKCSEIVQSEGLCGGHRGYVDDMLTSISNEVFNEIENRKKDINS